MGGHIHTPPGNNSNLSSLHNLYLLRRNAVEFTDSLSICRSYSPISACLACDSKSLVRDYMISVFISFSSVHTSQKSGSSGSGYCSCGTVIHLHQHRQHTQTINEEHNRVNETGLGHITAVQHPSIFLASTVTTLGTLGSR